LECAPSVATVTLPARVIAGKLNTQMLNPAELLARRRADDVVDRVSAECAAGDRDGDARQGSAG
jgi:hypothetical protein